MCGFFAHAVQLCNILDLQSIEIGGRLNQTGLNQLIQHRRAQAVNIHGVAGGKVGQIPQPLGGTLRAGTADGGAVFIPGHRRAADGTAIRQIIGHRARRPLLPNHLHDLGDDLPRLLYDHGIANADILLSDEILVVEGGKGNGGTRQAHRLQHGLGRQHTGPAHLDHDVLQYGGLLLRRIFIGDGPLGALGRAAQDGTVAQIVQLDDSAVDVKGVFHPLIAQTFDLGEDLICRLQPLVGDHLEMLGGQIVDGLRMSGKLPSLRQLQIEDGNIQPPLGGNLGIQLPQRAGRRVPRVGHQRLALDLPPGVDLLKDLAGHIDLAPHDEPGQLVRQNHGNGADGAEILRHVLPHPAVAPGSAADKHAVPILQRHGQAVHFRLYAVRHTGQRIIHPIQELPHLVAVKHVLEALQRNRVLHRGKFAQRRTAHPLGRRIRRDLLRVLPLQILQAAQHPVIFKV